METRKEKDMRQNVIRGRIKEIAKEMKGTWVTARGLEALYAAKHLDYPVDSKAISEYLKGNCETKKVTTTMYLMDDFDNPVLSSMGWRHYHMKKHISRAIGKGFGVKSSLLRALVKPKGVRITTAGKILDTKLGEKILFKPNRKPRRV